MILIEYPLERLQDSVSRFIVPSAALSDIQALRSQIELRRRALRDIEVIRSRLRLWDGRATTMVSRRGKGGSTRGGHLARLRRGRSFARPS